ncbi:MAG: NAD(P)/FAD-dependent oxidoreductase [Alphaproteobacteria bacterium]|nr:NAD(P)/FAD-dependent oxidoreductase [Alphaproteobacteria bacterium]MCB9929620.1 NAD(P)/FAD-dependent oxidoreductase [Alphaproteobacteria bacterium]
MNHVESQGFAAQDELATDAIVSAWLQAFEAALTDGDQARLAALFTDDANWRDVLAFTWHLTPHLGADAIAAGLAARQPAVAAKDFAVSETRTPPRRVKRLGRDCVEALHRFETKVGRGEGVVRLVPAADGGAAGHRAWVFSTSLQELKGFEEKIGAKRPTGEAYSRNFGGDNWEDVRRKAQAYDDRDPTVLVVGGAQAGLSIAARLNQLGVDNLVVERWPRIGDSWRKRYHSLALHNSIKVNNLPYLPFPETWPNYIPKDMLGLWFEFYAQVMEINHWTNTEFTKGEWDEAARQWTATLKLADGSERVMHPRHIVFANGVSSYPLVPDIPGLDSFRGEVIHSEGFDSGAPFQGKRAIVIGTGSSANDIALDLYNFGCETTIVQRGSTTVVSIDPSAKLNYALYDEGLPVEECDLMGGASTPPMIVKGYQLAVQRMVELDKDMIAGLKGIGFKFDIGEDNTGHQMKYRRRGGGYNLDAGSSDLMIRGEIGLLQNETIERYGPEGAVLKDGTVVPADLIVLATGYYPQAELVRRALGEDVAAKIGPIWGEGADGELANMYKRTSQPGAWFIAGSLTQARIYSKYMALQIKAMEEGLVDTDPFA